MSFTCTVRWVLRKVLSFVPRKPCLFHTELNEHNSTLLSIAYILTGGIGDCLWALQGIRSLIHTQERVSVFPRIDIYVPKRHWEIIQRLDSQLPLFMYKPIVLFFSRGFDTKKRYDAVVTNATAVFQLSCEIVSWRIGKHSYGFRYPKENPQKRLYCYSRQFNPQHHPYWQNRELFKEVFGIAWSEPRLKPAYCIPQSLDAPICIHPGSEKGYEHKRWSVHRYKNLAKRLTGLGYHVTIVLGSGEMDLMPFFQDISSITLIQGDAQRFLQTIRYSRLFIGNDSGPAHVAAWFGIPCLVLYGPTLPAACAPLGTQWYALSSSRECSPCHFTQRSCSNACACMNTIGIDCVIRTALSILEAQSINEQRGFEQTSIH